MDKLTKEQRSRLMSEIRGKETGFEKKIFRALRSNGISFQTNYTQVIGKPDIAKPKSKRAVFLHSDFWHGWQYPKWSKILPNHFWNNKIMKNRARDKKVLRILRRKGWEVKVLWEHTYKQRPETSINTISKFLK